MRPALLLLLAVSLAPASARATVLCLTKAGTVKARVACKKHENALQGTDLGLQCQCTSTPTTTLGTGHCAFRGTSCTTDVDCGIPGLCALTNSSGTCVHVCGLGVPCPSGMSCFQTGGPLGEVCVGCGGDSSKCTVGETCPYDNCIQFGHPECASPTAGAPCTISDRCVHS